MYDDVILEGFKEVARTIQFLKKAVNDFSAAMAYAKKRCGSY